MATIIKDDRTDAQKRDLDCIVLATDSFMSGWGPCRHGNSYAGWACHHSDVDTVERAVRARGEMKRVRIVGADYRPSSYCAHLHIYVANIIEHLGRRYLPWERPDLPAA